jgi:hypothetical protein
MIGLHVVARAALRFVSPDTALRILRLVGRAIPPLTVPEGKHYAASLNGHGTCLSRSLCVASRLSDACVVIGVIPLRERPVSGVASGMRGREVMRAHAWVEVGGRPLVAHEPAGLVIGHLHLGRRREGCVVLQRDAGKELVR